jgi:hypothetical protein
MEQSLHGEFKKLQRFLKKTSLGKPITLDQKMSVSTFNALWSILVGENFELDDPEFQKLTILFEQLVKSGTIQNPISQILPRSMLSLPGNNTSNVRGQMRFSAPNMRSGKKC